MESSSSSSSVEISSPELSLTSSSSSSQPWLLSMDATWLERLLLNLFSYSLVLVPIAVIVIATKYKLFPSFLRSSALIQLFVNGSYYHATSRQQQQQQQIHNDALTQDRENLLAQDDDHSQRRKSTRRGIVSSDDDDGNEQLHDNRKNVFKFFWCFFGLMISYLIWGILQEKIMTTKYATTTTENNISIDNQNLNQTNEIFNNNKKHETHITFHDSQFLVFINRIIAFILAILALIYDRPKNSKPSATKLLFLSNGKYKVQYQNVNSTTTTTMKTSSTTNQRQNQESSAFKSPAPLYKFVYCSMSNILSSWCQYEALKYVNFPTQVLSKTFKIVPVMIMSKILLHKKYKPLDYICALALSLGMFIFLVNQPAASSSNRAPNNHSATTNHHHHIENRSGLNLETSKYHSDIGSSSSGSGSGSGSSTLLSGLILLSLYLAFDSFTGNWQKSLFTRYQVTNWQMMAAVNLYSILLTLTSLYQLDNLTPALKLLASSRSLMFDCLLMSVMSSVGQFFVYYTINQFGPVIFTVIMTFRQFLAILISCALYKHQVTAGSSLGILLVFLVVAFQLWHRSSSHHGKSPNSTANSSAHTGRINFQSAIIRK